MAFALCVELEQILPGGAAPAHSIAYQVDMRATAHVVAINRVATVTKLRGLDALRTDRIEN